MNDNSMHEECPTWIDCIADLSQLLPNELGGLSLEMTEIYPRDVWPIDWDPADVNGSDVICRSSEPALLTEKAIPVQSIPPGDMTATWTGAASIPWINKQDRYSCKSSLILNKATELVERPRVVYATLVSSNRYPFTDALQILEGYTAPGVLRLRDDPLGDYMVNIGCKPVLSSTSFPEKPLSRFCSLTLKPTPQLRISTPESVKMSTDVCVTISIYRGILDAEIHAQISLSFKGFRFRGVDSSCKVEYAVSEEEVCLPSDTVKSCLLVGAYLNWDYLSSLQSQDANPVKSFPAKDSGIVYHGAVGLELAKFRFISFECLGYLAYGPDCHLGAEPVLLSNSIVDDFLEPDLVGRLFVVGYLGYVVAGLVKSLHSFKKCLVLFWCWNQFNEKSQLHLHRSEHSIGIIFTFQFLPRIKSGVRARRQFNA